MRGRIEQAIREAIPGVSFVVERPADFAHGDYSTNAALVSKTDPHELATTLKIEGVEKIEVVGKFINFFLSNEELVPKERVIPQLYAGKTILVEYTSPNLFKPLHIGNLIGNILGESIARLLESSGADVKRINYPSDIGLTVAKGVWGLTQTKGNPEDIKALGEAYVAGNAAYEDGSAKEKIEEINKALYEDSNAEWSSLRKKGVETSRKHLDDLCERLGTTFDAEFFESESGPLGREIVNAHQGDVFEKSDGAVVFKGEQYGLHTRVFLNSQGLPTYEAKEVGLFELKYKTYPHFDTSITVTGGEQSGFFKVVFCAIQKIFAEKIGEKKLMHIANGFLKLTTGKMSSRLGNVITGESLLEDLQKAARGREDVAVGAIKYAVLRQASNKDIVFDPEKSLSLEGDSGPYVQYALVRARALIKKASAEKRGVAASGIVAEAKAKNPIGDGKTWPSGPERRPSSGFLLERMLIHFPDVVERAAKELEPHFVTTYITELAAAFNSWYASEKIVGSPNESYGILLTGVVEKTLAKGLWVLGIPAPEEM